MAAEPDREPNGQFAVGGKAGPGRPRKAKQLADTTLREIATPMEASEMLFTAKALAEQADTLDYIERTFPKKVADRIKRMTLIADMAQSEIIRRLRDVPL